MSGNPKPGGCWVSLFWSPVLWKVPVISAKLTNDAASAALIQTSVCRPIAPKLSVSVSKDGCACVADAGRVTERRQRSCPHALHKLA
ncbi:hypothetical protein D4764_10G0006500 [Takifugu flavidus]|uniref:Secreted protein n=1 Tax=Takifugu flavidus TaxID=433684 RepID=A0A5C6PMV0_9TELE|nr:hypothetical protein D4764_10G0006500 [Takifugu flavidus]